MTDLGRIVKALHERMNASDEKEVYRQLEKTSWYRTGLGVRLVGKKPPALFLEVTLRLSSSDGAVDVARLEKITAVLRGLQARSYLLMYHDGGTVDCEKAVEEEKLPEDYGALRVLLRE